MKPQFEATPLFERMRWMQIVRLMMVAAVAGSPILIETSWRLRELAGGILAYCAFMTIHELARRSRSRGLALKTSNLVLVVDGVAIAAVLAVSGPEAAVLIGLVHLHLGAVALLLSYRTAVKLAAWHSLMLAAAQSLAAEASSAIEWRLATAHIVMFWLIGVVVTCFSALNERELRRGKAEVEQVNLFTAELETARSSTQVLDMLQMRLQALVEKETAIIVERRDGWAISHKETSSASTDHAIQRSLELGEPIALTGLDASSSPIIHSFAGTDRALVIPVVTEEPRAVAVIRSMGRLNASTYRLIKNLANQAELVFRNRMLVAELTSRAGSDGLTGIPNRRSFDDYLRTELDSDVPRTERLFLAMFDVDFFKAINDELGHLAGDDVLRSIGRTFTDSIRPTDFAARYGGEEFALVIAAADLNEARSCATRIRKAAGAAASETLGRPVTLSVGLAESISSDATELIGTADRLLYKAKSNGRDRLEVAEEPSRAAPVLAD